MGKVRGAVIAVRTILEPGKERGAGRFGRTVIQIRRTTGNRAREQRLGARLATPTTGEIVTEEERHGLRVPGLALLMGRSGTFSVDGARAATMRWASGTGKNEVARLVRATVARAISMRCKSFHVMLASGVWR